MNDTILPILSRRSVRAYTAEPVTDSDVQALLEAAMSAPSAMATDPWRFLVLRDRADLAALADILPHGKMLNSAPVGIVVCGEQACAHRQELSYLLQDCSAAVENLLLAASLMGLGAVWLGVHPNADRVDGIRARFGVPPEILPIAAIAVGHPAEAPAPRSRFRAGSVHLGRW